MVTILVFSQISLYLYISSERKWNRPHLQFKSALLFLVLARETTIFDILYNNSTSKFRISKVNTLK